MKSLKIYIQIDEFPPKMYYFGSFRLEKRVWKLKHGEIERRPNGEMKNSKKIAVPKKSRDLLTLQGLQTNISSLWQASNQWNLLGKRLSYLLMVSILKTLRIHAVWSNENKPGSAQVGAISKAQKYQKDFKMSKYW